MFIPFPLKTSIYRIFPVFCLYDFSLFVTLNFFSKYSTDVPKFTFELTGGCNEGEGEVKGEGERES